MKIKNVLTGVLLLFSVCVFGQDGGAGIGFFTAATDVAPSWTPGASTTFDSRFAVNVSTHEFWQYTTTWVERQWGTIFERSGAATAAQTWTLGNFDHTWNLDGTGDFIIQDAGAEFFRVADNGRVGIGTATPNQQLEITGHFRMAPSTSTAGIIYQGGSRFLHGRLNNTYIGRDAGNTTGTGGYNIGIGQNAGISMTTATQNVIIGDFAGDALTTGTSNVAIGYEALSASATSTGSVFIGTNAGRLATDGSDSNIGIGSNTLRALTGGDRNIAIGPDAGIAVSSATNNVIIGIQSGDITTTGSSNTFIGYQTGRANITGTQNVCIGNQANVSASGNTREIVIGSNAVGNGTNTITIGDANATKLYTRNYIFNISQTLDSSTDGYVLTYDNATNTIFAKAVRSGIGRQSANATGTYTIVDSGTDRMLYCEVPTMSGNTTIQLPTPSSSLANVEIIIKFTDLASNTATIQAASGTLNIEDASGNIVTSFTNTTNRVSYSFVLNNSYTVWIQK